MAKKKEFVNCALNVDTVHTMKHVPIASVHVTVKKWSDRINGNTYNSLEIAVLIQGEKSYRDLAVFSLVYGYGSYYMQRARELFENLGYNLNDYAITESEHYTLKRNCFNAADMLENESDSSKWQNANKHFNLEQL